MNKTPNDMLTAVVSAGVKGGADLLRNPNRRNQRILQISQELVVFIEYDYDSLSRIGRPVKQAYITYSLPDLITDPEFMKAIYGENEVCKICGGSQWSSNIMPKVQCYNCIGIIFIPAYLYHGTEAYKLMLTQSTDEAIKYLYQNMPEEGSSE